VGAPGPRARPRHDNHAPHRRSRGRTGPPCPPSSRQSRHHCNAAGLHPPVVPHHRTQHPARTGDSTVFPYLRHAGGHGGPPLQIPRYTL